MGSLALAGVCARVCEASGGGCTCATGALRLSLIVHGWLRRPERVPGARLLRGSGLKVSHPESGL